MNALEISRILEDVITNLLATDGVYSKEEIMKVIETEADELIDIKNELQSETTNIIKGKDHS